MRRANAGNAPRYDLAALGNEGRKHAHIFVVNVVDSFHAESTYFLAPEILLLGGQRFVAAGGSHRSANGTSASLFSHAGLLFLLRCWGARWSTHRSAWHGSSRPWTRRFGRARHHMFERYAGSRRRGRFAGGARFG